VRKRYILPATVPIDAQSVETSERPLGSEAELGKRSLLRLNFTEDLIREIDILHIEAKDAQTGPSDCFGQIDASMSPSSSTPDLTVMNVVTDVSADCREMEKVYSLVKVISARTATNLGVAVCA
jgi:hypothetical protein